MSALTALFYVFAAMAVFGALRVITSRNPIHSALYLVLTFVSVAAIWMLLKAEFLAIVLVLVYVGAVMVLFLFVVMMLDINMDSGGRGFWRSSVAIFVGIAVALQLAAVLFLHFKGVWITDAPPLPADYKNTEALGSVLYTEYVYPFELAAVVLLVAIVAAIALTLRQRKDVRYNDPSKAVRTRAADRLRVVEVAPVVRAEAAPDAPAADAADGGPAK
ncbi:MAG: NADH-quinone oxidoreductase subunit J [Burkholderiaceae bacterium]